MKVVKVVNASVSASFLNLDLELESHSELGALAEELGRRAFVLFSGPSPNGYRLSLEPVIDGSLDARAGACTEHFLTLLEGLSPKGAATLLDCTSRVFDYGFDGGLEAGPLHTDLSHAHLARMAALGLGLRVTTYPFRDYDAEDADSSSD
jgi:hypothetical protein